MFVSRRALISAVATALAPAVAQPAASDRPIRAVCFDAFPIFNPANVLATAKQVSPDLGAAWFQKIFADTWLRTAAHQYVPFPTVIAEMPRLCRKCRRRHAHAHDPRTAGRRLLGAGHLAGCG